MGGLGAGETGAILSNGTGTLRLSFGKARTINYALTYSGLSNVLQSHIHFGKTHVAGGIIAFLCTNLGNGPAGTPACPTTGGTVIGTIIAAGIQAVPGQNVAAGDFDALTDALASNTAYANVHTKAFPSGEIRGQVRRTDKSEQ